AVRSLCSDRTRVAVVVVSVDPVGDTLASVRRFFRVHHLVAEFHYLSGPRRLLAPIWQAYGVKSVAQAGDRVDHTLYTLLLDKRGLSRVLYDSTAPAAYVQHDVRLLL